MDSGKPASWRSRHLGELAIHLSRGRAPTYSETPTSIRAINQKCIRDGYIETASSRSHNDAIRIESANLLRDGDICINSTGTGTAGRVGIWKKRSDGVDYFPDSHVTLLRTSADVEPTFLGQAFQWSQIQRDVLGCLTGSTNQIELSRVLLAGLTIDLPPLPEQKKIAAILSSVDDAIQATQAVIDQTRQVKKGLLQELLTRGIGPDGRAHTRFKKTEIGEIPESWQAVHLDDLAEVRSGIAKNTKAKLADPFEVAYLRVANVQDGFLDLAEIKTIRIESDSLDRYRLLPGDVLMNEGGDIDKLGRGDVWQGQIEPCVHQNHVFSVRCDQARLRPRYLSFLAESTFGKAYFLSTGKQTTNLASINKSQLRSFPVPLPPIEEQDRIINRLEFVRTTEIANQETLGAAQQTKTGLLQDLLTGKVRVTP